MASDGGFRSHGWKRLTWRTHYRHSRGTVLAVILSVSAILVATLSPSYETASAEQPFCLLCGARGAADAISNVLLFVPLGAALGLVRLALLGALSAGAGLSLFVELAQFAIVPGRDASPSDLLFNTIGTGLGYAAWRTTIRSLHIRPALAAWLSPAAAGLSLSAIALTGYLLSPSLPRTPYAGQWTESPGHLEMYDGRILEATLGSVPIPPRPLEQSGQIRDLLLAGAPLDIRLVAGPPTRRLGQLFAIVEHDANQEILLLGIHGDDLVVRYRARANDVRLDAGALRVSNVLAGVSPGSAVRVVMWAEPDGYCVSVNAMRTCRLAFTAANGWLVLHAVDSWPEWLRTGVSAGWLAALFIPVGFWMRRQWSSFIALLIMSIGLGILPRAVGLSPPSPIESTGAVLGILLGTAFSVIAMRKRSAGERPWRRDHDRGGANEAAARRIP